MCHFMALLAGVAPIEQWQFHILQRGGAGEEIEALENESEGMAADERALVFVEVFHCDAFEAIGAGVRAIETS